jgi:hypothetical protein
MNKLIATAVAAISLAGVAYAEDMESTSVTTTTTEGAGTISAFTPGSALVVKSSAVDPINYRLGETVSYVTTTGEAIQPAEIRVGMPVTVHYKTVGSDRMVDRVVVNRTTTTTTTKEVDD